MITEGAYTGTVWHTRFRPKTHAFTYKLMMAAVDLSRVTSDSAFLRINKKGIYALRKKDHFPNQSGSITDHLRQYIPQSIHEKAHRIILLSQMAHFGFAFNPISFFAIVATDTNALLGVILEVHNTPWGERHFYPLFNLKKEQNTYTETFKKVLHVSPFMQMDYHYQFELTQDSDTLRIKLENWKNGNRHFAAGVRLQHHPASKMKKQFFSNLLSPQKAVLAIYWQAFKLWAKKFPLYSHPKWNNTP